MDLRMGVDPLLVGVGWQLNSISHCEPLFASALFLKPISQGFKSSKKLCQQQKLWQPIKSYWCCLMLIFLDFAQMWYLDVLLQCLEVMFDCGAVGWLETSGSAYPTCMQPCTTLAFLYFFTSTFFTFSLLLLICWMIQSLSLFTRCTIWVIHMAVGWTVGWTAEHSVNQSTANWFTKQSTAIFCSRLICETRMQQTNHYHRSRQCAICLKKSTVRQVSEILDPLLPYPRSLVNNAMSSVD